MQHDCVLKKLNFDPRVRGGVCVCVCVGGGGVEGRGGGVWW